MRKKILFLAGMMACCSLAGPGWLIRGMELIRTRFFMQTIRIRMYVQPEMISI